jgi:hypothetical protein
MNFFPFYLDHQKDSGHRLNGDRVVPLHAARSLQKIDKLINGGVRFIRAAAFPGFSRGNAP